MLKTSLLIATAGIAIGAATASQQAHADPVAGAIVPSLIAWFVVAPLKGQPGFVDLPLASILTALAINGAWGLGTGAFLLLFGRSHVPE